VTITEHDGRPLSVGRKTGPFRRPCVAPSEGATVAAASPVVTSVASSTPTTSSTGRMAAIEIEGLLWSEGLLRLGWNGSTPEELRRGSAEPEAAAAKLLT
jgi:hypothetical protein